MPLYRVLNTEQRLQPFRSTEFGSHYQEKELEDWLEANPQVLVSDEPLLVIGRQVNTPVGSIDLLALDSNGAAVIAELKRAPDQRGAIAQALEYAAWLSEQADIAVRRIAEVYLSRKRVNQSLEQAWQQTFNSDLHNLSLNQQHRIFIVVEGDNERMASVVRYLRNAGVDISLLAYNYYRTESNEEILHIEIPVGDDELSSSATIQSKWLPTEAELLNGWSQEVNEAYAAFKEHMVHSELTPKPLKTQVSFSKRTDGGDVFICGFHGSGRYFKTWLRSDSLQSRFDFKSVAQGIRDRVGKDASVLHTDTWFILTYPASAEYGTQVADLIINEIVSRVK